MGQVGLDLSWAAQEESSRAFEVFLHDEELAALRDAESVSSRRRRSLRAQPGAEAAR